MSNNGHTIQLAAAPGSTLSIGKESYDLVQFHFHTPSEHIAVADLEAMVDVTLALLDAAREPTP